MKEVVNEWMKGTIYCVCVYRQEVYKMRNLAVRAFKIATVFTVPFLLLLSGINVHAAADTIYNGILVESVDISGMTVPEATTRINQYVDSLKEVEITLTTPQGEQTVLTAGELGLTWANDYIVDDACSYGKKGNVVQRYKAIKDLERENKVFSIEFDMDQNAIAQLMEEKCSAFNVEAKDAVLKKVDGAFVIEEGQTGLKVNAAESAKTLIHYLQTDWEHTPAAVELVVDVANPRGTKEELEKVKDVIGTYTTDFHTSGSARTANVINGCRLINGTTLYPGDTFSAYEHVNPFTEENGYYLAGSYLNGMVVESLGGGICQVSTTLYNAVLNAELQVDERFNHSMIVSYVPPSQDAAISGTSKDFKFTNNTGAPIYIEGSTSSNKKITFTIYGVETRTSDRVVSYESEVLKTTQPDGERIIADASLPVGSIDVQSAHIGYVARLWKVVTENGVEVSRTEVNKSTYQVSPRTATVGVSTADPAVYNAMQAAIATGNIDHVKGVVAAYNAAQQQIAAQQQAAVQNSTDAATAAN